MPEFIANIVHSTPKDLSIVELTATVADDGIQINAKSAILADFISAKHVDCYKGDEYVRGWKGLEIYTLPGRITADIGGNGIYGDMFIHGRDGVDGVRTLQPNMIWMRMKGLADGVTFVFPQPAHVPADLVEYLNKSMDKTRMFYQRFIRKVTVTANLIERE